MWPKALAQLIELLPHAARLLPLADRFLSSKTANEEASRKAMEQMAEGLRGDLGQVTASHAGLYRQLNEQSVKLDDLAVDVRAARLAADSSDARLAAMERQIKSLRILLWVAIGLLTGTLLLVALRLRS